MIHNCVCWLLTSNNSSWQWRISENCCKFRYSALLDFSNNLKQCAYINKSGNHVVDAATSRFWYIGWNQAPMNQIGIFQNNSRFPSQKQLKLKETKLHRIMYTVSVTYYRSSPLMVTNFHSKQISRNSQPMQIRSHHMIVIQTYTLTQWSSDVLQSVYWLRAVNFLGFVQFMEFYTTAKCDHYLAFESTDTKHKSQIDVLTNNKRPIESVQ